MTDSDFKKLGEVIKEEIRPVKETLNNPKTGLKRINEKMDALWDQVETVTLGIEDVKETLDSHTAQLKSINSC